MGLSKTYKLSFLLAALLVVASCFYTASSVATTAVHSASSECELPVKGLTVHNFVKNKLHFEYLARHQSGTVYYSPSSQYGIPKRPKKVGVKKKVWHRAVGERNANARWIYVPYSSNDQVYPTLTSEAGKPSLNNFLSRNVLVSSPSMRSRMIDTIYDLAARGSASWLQAGSTAVKPCKTLSGSVLWREVFVKQFRYKKRRAKGRFNRDNSSIVYVSRDRDDFAELSDRAASRIRTWRSYDLRMLRDHLGLTNMRDSERDRLIDELRETYYIPE